jgi:hypothetical protein
MYSARAPRRDDFESLFGWGKKKKEEKAERVEKEENSELEHASEMM